MVSTNDVLKRLLTLSILLIVLLLVPGCHKAHEYIEVLVRNNTDNALQDVHIELTLHPGGPDYEKRTIQKLRPGRYVKLLFPAIKGGEGTFRITGKTAGGTRFSGEAAYLEHYVEACMIEFNTTADPPGLKIDSLCDHPSFEVKDGRAWRNTTRGKYWKHEDQ